jgi:nicotinamide-nucleotide amidase
MKTLFPKKITDLAQKIVTTNAASGRTIAIAESCTGGLLSAAITEIPGSSAVFKYGFVTYADEAKMEALGVPLDVLETFGAVSIAVAWSMALGALEKSGADVAIAISGIAGPDGGSEQKPIGTVVFAIAEKGKSADDVIAGRENFGPELSRAEIRMAATLHALELLAAPSA